jgi:hypothetical protein
LPFTRRNESISVDSPLRGSKRPRKRIDGTSFRIADGAAALGWKTSVSIPFGMICQGALK